MKPMGRVSTPVALLATVALVSAPGSVSRAQQAPKHVAQQVQNEINVELPSLSPIVKRVLAAVVNVSVTMEPGASPIADETPQGSGNESLDELLRRFFEQYGRTPRGGEQGQPDTETMALGSGFIIDPAGYVVTNNHVVEHAERVMVIMQDKSRHRAQLVGHDDKTDLALLKIDAPKPLPFVQWGDSAQTEVGDWVVAVGNPFGLGGTVTAGILSARGRDIEEGPYDNFLQIDAPINRGNSGGPTFNLRGEVIGINTAIYSPSGGSVGIGFAIPSDFARLIIDQIRSTGSVERGWLGVSIQPMNPALAKAFGANPEKPDGALVDDVEQESPAAKAGIKRGDVIIKLNGKKIRSAHDLPRVVAIIKPGQKLDITLLRDGKDEEVAATVAPTPAQLADPSATEGSSSAKQQVGTFGIAFQPLTPELRKQFHARAATRGVVVQGVLPGSPGAQLGLKPGDVVESVNREQLDSPQDAETKIEKAAHSGTIILFVDRDGSGQYIGVSKE